MALLLIDGFDLYDTVARMNRRGWTDAGAAALASAALSLIAGPFAGRAAAIDNATAQSTATALRRSFAAQTGIGWQCWLFIAQIPTTTMTLVSLREGTTEHVNVRLNTAGNLIVARSTTALATGSTPLTAGRWHHLELNTTIADAGGTFDLRVGGTTLVSGTGDTRNAGTGVVDNILLRQAIHSAPAGVTAYDSLVVYTLAGAAPNAFLGVRWIETLRPTADVVASFARQPADAASNAAIAGATIDTGRFLHSETVAARDLYALSDLTGAPTTVHLVNLVAYLGRPQDLPREMRTVLRSGATDALGATLTPAQPDGRYEETLHLTDPATGLAWTPAGVNAAQAGAEIVS
jgi:hypothetical protein